MSAIVIWSPKQYFPLEFFNIASIVSNPLVAQYLAQAILSPLKSAEIFYKTLKFWYGCIPELITSQNPLIWALRIGSFGNKGWSGYVSSKYSIIATDSIKTCPVGKTKAGTA